MVGTGPSSPAAGPVRRPASSPAAGPAPSWVAGRLLSRRRSLRNRRRALGQAGEEERRWSTLGPSGVRFPCWCSGRARLWAPVSQYSRPGTTSRSQAGDYLSTRRAAGPHHFQVAGGRLLKHPPSCCRGGAASAIGGVRWGGQVKRNATGALWAQVGCGFLVGAAGGPAWAPVSQHSRRGGSPSRGHASPRHFQVAGGHLLRRATT
eukprot:COSAG02_NODE_11605_length_1690_cov_8.552264_2_plen_206_part_00